MPDNTLTKRTWLDKFLDGLERGCNKLPPPAIMFIYLFVIVAVISALLSLAGVSAVNPSTKEVVAIQNPISSAGLIWFLENMLKNFTGFAPLGLVITMTLAIGMCEESGLIMALLSSYFFVAERQQINEWFREHMPSSILLRYRMICDSLLKSVGGYLKAQLKIEVWMYFLLLIGLGILRVNYFAVIALVIAFLDFLPFLGTGTVLIPWAVIRILTAEYKTAIGLLVIWCVGQLARQLIQPKIVGDSIGVPPLPTLFLLYIGYKVSGVIGMIIAVPIGLLVYTLYEDGAFDTTKNSILILTAGVNRFRSLGKEDLAEVETMKLRNRQAAETLKRREQMAKEKESHKKYGEK